MEVRSYSETSSVVIAALSVNTVFFEAKQYCSSNATKRCFMLLCVFGIFDAGDSIQMYCHNPKVFFATGINIVLIVLLYYCVIFRGVEGFVRSLHGDSSVCFH